MIWGDPSNYEEKMQTEGRFEFGSKQFDRFANRNQIGLLFRSHEEEPHGYKPFFENRLYTIFSTGGMDNCQTGYPAVEPAFAVIQNERFFIEHSFVYRIIKDRIPIIVNLFNKQKYIDKQQEGLNLDKEFECDEEKGAQIRSIFKKVLEAFPPDEAK